MNDLFDIEGKVALVTGGSGHLGSEMVRTLRDFGATVVVGDLSEDGFNDRFSGEERIEFMKFDISDRDAISKRLEEVVTNYGSLDIMIHSAFFGAHNTPDKMTGEEWRKGIDGALNSTFDMITLGFPHMKEKGGKIILLSSMYGVVVPDLSIYEGREEVLNPPNYGVGKAGVVHLTKYYAMYLAKYSINVNAISPGPFPNPKIQQDDVFMERLKEKTLLKRIGQPKDLSGAVMLLASGASDYITGQNIIVDGGWTV